MTKDSVGAVKAGELLSGQIKLKSDKTQVFQNGSVTSVTNRSGAEAIAVSVSVKASAEKLTSRKNGAETS